MSTSDTTSFAAWENQWMSSSVLHTEPAPTPFLDYVRSHTPAPVISWQFEWVFTEQRTVLVRRFSDGTYVVATDFECFFYRTWLSQTT